jgi:hypothetical protein
MRYALWFRWAVLIGVLQDVVMGVPGIFVPNWVLGWFGEQAAQPIWPAFGSQMVVLLSLFYIPAALDPYRYRPIAFLTVGARAAGVLFFLVLWRGQGPAIFGYIDLFFGVVQATLLWLTLREPRQAVLEGAPA